jgi:hypothetical protein
MPPPETYNYVFYIVSAAVIGENPRLFGFNFNNPLDAPAHAAGVSRPPVTNAPNPSPNNPKLKPINQGAVVNQRAVILSAESRAFCGLRSRRICGCSSANLRFTALDTNSSAL